MNRLVTTLATGAVIGAVLTASPAMAEAKKGPKLGAWTCDNAGVPFATLDLFKGNKYAANGEAEKGKYVYKAGQKKLKFKSGTWEGVLWGEYDRDAKAITLYSVETSAAEAVCTQAVVEPELEPETEG